MKLIIVCLLIINILYAKKDFYYGFIDSNGEQISEQKKQAISDGFDMVQNIRNLSKEDKIDDAYKQIKNLKDQNKSKILISDIMILYAELALKKQAKRIVLDAVNELEKAINSSQISQSDLPKAYMLMVDLKLEVNKTDDAKYFAQIIIDNFDDEKVKTHGKIAMAKVYKYQKDYPRAIKYLFEILTTTKNKYIATLVADELFDLYVIEGKYDKANELITQVLKNNMEFYTNDSYLANKKINRLIKAGMPEHAVEILNELLKKATKDEVIEDFKFKLANTYMLLNNRTNQYLDKSKELYQDIINDYPQGLYVKNSKMYLDEILMRQGFINPNVIEAKYHENEQMLQKALLQELLNDIKEKKYEIILRSEKVYRKISNEIFKRFGYENLEQIFDEVNIDLIKDYLEQGKCAEINSALQTAKNKTLERLIQDENLKYNFFECLVESPYQKAYLQIKETFNKTRDANIYLYLEKMAYSLGLIDEALDFSIKVEMVGDKKVLEKEYLYKYQIYKTKDDLNLLEKFFFYTSANPEFLKLNENDPAILDIYYDYYSFLLKNDDKKTVEILDKLYKKQKDFKVFIYSPYVETELARIAKEKDEKQKSLELLQEALSHTRKIKPEDEVKIYYDISSLYESLGNKAKKDEYIMKCRDVKNLEDNLYKKICDEKK